VCAGRGRAEEGGAPELERGCRAGSRRGGRSGRRHCAQGTGGWEEDKVAEKKREGKN